MAVNAVWDGDFAAATSFVAEADAVCEEIFSGSKMISTLTMWTVWGREPHSLTREPVPLRPVGLVVGSARRGVRCPRLPG
jgi:hypothetical protein